MDKIIQNLESWSWWFDLIAGPILFGAAALIWRGLTVAMGRMTWADMVLACHCLVAAGLAAYVGVWTPMLETGPAGWQHWNARLAIIVFAGYAPITPFIGPVNPEWPKKAIALIYSCITALFVLLVVFNSQPLWQEALTYCALLSAAGVLYFFATSFVEENRHDMIDQNVSPYDRRRD